MAEEREFDDFVSIDDSLDNIENILTDIKKSVDEPRIINDEDDNFMSSDEAAGFFQSVNGINDTLASMNSYLQNSGSINAIEETTVEQPNFLETNSSVANTLTENDNSSFVEQLDSINSILVDINKNITGLDVEQITDLLKSAQTTANEVNFTTTNETTNLNFNELKTINESYESINQEIRTLGDSINDMPAFETLKGEIDSLKDSLSDIDFNGGSSFLKEFDELSAIDWNKSLLEPLKEARKLISDSIAQGDISKVLDGFSLDGLNLDKIHELEESLTNIVAQAKEFNVDAGTINNLEETQERISNVTQNTEINPITNGFAKEVPTGPDSLNDFVPVENTVTPFNNTIQQTTKSESEQTLNLETPVSLTTENSNGFELNNEQPGNEKLVDEVSGQPKLSDSSGFDVTQVPAVQEMNDFVREDYKSDLAADEVKNTINNESNKSTNENLQQIVELLKIQNELMSKFIPTQVSVETPAVAISNQTTSNNSNDTTKENPNDINSSEAIMLLQQLVSLGLNGNELLSALAKSIKTINNTKQKPIG